MQRRNTAVGCGGGYKTFGRERGDILSFKGASHDSFETRNSSENARAENSKRRNCNYFYAPFLRLKGA